MRNCFQRENNLHTAYAQLFSKASANCECATVLQTNWHITHAQLFSIAIWQLAYCRSHLLSKVVPAVKNANLLLRGAIGPLLGDPDGALGDNVEGIPVGGLSKVDGLF